MYWFFFLRPLVRLCWRTKCKAINFEIRKREKKIERMQYLFYNTHSAAMLSKLFWVSQFYMWGLFHLFRKPLIETTSRELHMSQSNECVCVTFKQISRFDSGTSILQATKINIKILCVFYRLELTWKEPTLLFLACCCFYYNRDH